MLNILSKVEENNNDTKVCNEKTHDVNTNIVNDNDNKGLLSPTIDDVISNLNPNRPIFPSPITLIDNTVTLSSSPIHYSTEQFDEIDNNYNEFNNDTKVCNEKSHDINTNIVNDNENVDFNKLNSIIAKSSVDSNSASIATSVRLLFLVQNYLGIRTYDHMRKKRALRASHFVRLKKKYDNNDDGGDGTSYDQQNIRNTSTNATLIEEDGTLDAWLIFCPALVIYSHIYNLRKQNTEYLLNYEEWLQHKVLELTATQLKSDIFRALCLYCGTNSSARIHHERRLLHTGFNTFVENVMKNKLRRKKKAYHYTGDQAINIYTNTRSLHRDLPFNTNSTKYSNQLPLLGILSNLRKSSEKLYGSSTFFKNSKKYTNVIINTIFRKRNSIYNLYANYMAASVKDKHEIQEFIFDAIYLAFGLRRLYKRTIYYGKIEKLIKRRKLLHLNKTMKHWIQQMSSYEKLSKEFDVLINQFQQNMISLRVKYSFHKLRKHRRESIEFKQFLKNYGKQLKRHHLGLRCAYMFYCPAFVKCFLMWQDLFVKDGMKVPEKRLAEKQWRYFRLKTGCSKWRNWTREVQSQLVPHKQFHGNALIKSSSNHYRISKGSQLVFTDVIDKNSTSRQSQLARAFWKLLSMTSVTRLYHSPSDMTFCDVHHLCLHQKGENKDKVRYKSLLYRRIASVKLYSTNFSGADIDPSGEALPMFHANRVNAITPIRAKYYGTLISKAANYRPSGGRSTKLVAMDDKYLTMSIRTFYGNAKGSNTIINARSTPKKRPIVSVGGGAEIEFKYNPKAPSLIMIEGGGYLASAPMLLLSLSRLLKYSRRKVFLKRASSSLSSISSSSTLKKVFLSWLANWKQSWFRNRRLRYAGFSRFIMYHDRVRTCQSTMRKSEKMRLRRNLRGFWRKTSSSSSENLDRVKNFILLVLKNSEYNYVMVRYGSKYRIKNVKSSIGDGTIFFRKPSSSSSSSSSSLSKKKSNNNNSSDIEHLDYFTILDQAKFVSSSLSSLSSLKAGLLRLRTHVARLRVRKARLGPVIQSEKRGVLVWMKRLMHLRWLSRIVLRKRSKVFLFRWVVSTVRKKANRALIRSHFIPLFNQYKKRRYQSAWDKTWGSRYRDAWSVWNRAVTQADILYNKVVAHVEKRVLYRYYSILKVYLKTQSHDRRRRKCIALKYLRRLAYKNIRLNRRIRMVALSLGIGRLYRRLNTATPHSVKSLQMIQNRAFSMRLLSTKGTLKALRYLRNSNNNSAAVNSDGNNTIKKLSNKKKVLSETTMVVNQIHFSRFCRRVLKMMKINSDTRRSNRLQENRHDFIVAKNLWIRAIRFTILGRAFFRELSVIADGFRNERSMRRAIVWWRFRARRQSNSRRWLRSADKYCMRRLKAWGLIFLRASAVYALPALYQRLSTSNFYPKSKVAVG